MDGSQERQKKSQVKLVALALIMAVVVSGLIFMKRNVSEVQEASHVVAAPSTSAVVSPAALQLDKQVKNVLSQLRNDRVYAALERKEESLSFGRTSEIRRQLAGRNLSDLPNDSSFVKMQLARSHSLELVTNYKARISGSPAHEKSTIQFVPKTEASAEDYSIVVDVQRERLGFWNGVVINLDTKKASRLPAGSGDSELTQLPRDQVPQIIFAPKIIK